LVRFHLGLNGIELLGLVDFGSLIPSVLRLTLDGNSLSLLLLLELTSGLLELLISLSDGRLLTEIRRRSIATNHRTTRLGTEKSLKLASFIGYPSLRSAEGRSVLFDLIK
jgi:hypothetical protein